MIQNARIQHLNNRNPENRDYILYWMQASQRVHSNHALEYAKFLANERNKPLVVYFGLTDRFPEANLRHFMFMLEGLGEVQKDLHSQNIPFIIRYESPETGVLDLALRSDVTVTDRGYLRIQKRWRQYVAERIDCPLIQIESDVVVPVEAAMSKEAYSAAVIRPKIHRLLDAFCVPLPEIQVKHARIDLQMDSLDLSDPAKITSRLQVDRNVAPSPQFRGGYEAARQHLIHFIENRLGHYGEKHNHPELAFQSELSSYLHFGQISPLEVALAIPSKDPGCAEFLEQLIIRRELAMNFVHFNSDYDHPNCLPDWALRTLSAHQKDVRPDVYSRQQLENAATHDPYWNAAQQELVKTGKMHGYMRMYWGKKILEWVSDLNEAYSTALYLNNKYNLDGRDPNGFAGVAWCFGKHDRPWAERAIFGTVRYMNDKGLKRKFDMESYIAKVNAL